MLIGSILFILFFLLIIRLIYHSKLFEIEGINKHFVLFAFLLKLISGFSLWLIYSHYYPDRSTADIFKYFDDATHIFNATKDQLSIRWQLLIGNYPINPETTEAIKNTQHWDLKEFFVVNDNRNMSRIHLLILHLSQGFFHLHTLIFCTFSMIGSIGIYRFFRRYSSLPSYIILAIVFFLPSTVFWSSAPLKECWLMFGLGLILWPLSFNPSTPNKLFKQILLFIIGFSALIMMKVYVIFALALPLFFILSNSIFSYKKNILLLIISCLLLIFGSILIGEDVAIKLANKQEEFLRLAISVNANSIIPVTSYSKLEGLILSIPNSLYNVIFRPLYPNSINVFSLIAAIEHILYAGIILLPIFFFKKVNSKELAFAIFCTLFVLLGFSIIGLSTPILGAIVRYKSIFLPFYIIAFLTFVDLKKIIR